MVNDKPLLQLNGVSKAYEPPPGGVPVSVLKDVSLTLTPGESLAIMGPSGSGKSTLLNIMGTLDTPSAGQAFFDGQDLSSRDDAQLADLRNRCIGFVFQSHHLLPQCTVLENVLVPALVCGDEGLKAGAPDRAGKLLERVGLKDRLAHRPGQLSGGERQRVAVVRALINEPKLVLADEPTGSLDRHTADRLTRLLVELHREFGMSLVLVSHAMHVAARMDRVLELQDGSLVPRRKDASS